MSKQTIPHVIEDLSRQARTNYMGFASFTMLIWDHIDTFADEVNYIWKGKKGPIVLLFLLNRYLMPLAFIVNLYAYLSPSWTPEMYVSHQLRSTLLRKCRMSRCDRFIRFEGAMTVIGINIVALMMFIRIRALYHDNIVVQMVVGTLLAVEFSVNAWLLAHGQRVRHNADSGVVACTMVFGPEVPGWQAAASAWLPLLYDTVVLGLTVHRTLPGLKQKGTSYIMRRLFQDGLVYYSAIFAVNLVLCLMIALAPPGLQNITAQLELLLTVAMMSRITINLKKFAHKVRTTIDGPPAAPGTFPSQRSSFYNTEGVMQQLQWAVASGPVTTRSSDHDGDVNHVNSRLTTETPSEAHDVCDSGFYQAEIDAASATGGSPSAIRFARRASIGGDGRRRPVRSQTQSGMDLKRLEISFLRE